MPNSITKVINTKNILWLIFLSLLGVLLPHTAWLFSKFEANSVNIPLVAWAAAFAFESAIAALTHKLAKHIEKTPRYSSGWVWARRISFRYINAYSAGLAITVAISALANLAHAVEYGQALKIFDTWGIPQQVYQLAFGAILPVVSLLFARVLSNVQDGEKEVDPKLDAERKENRELRARLKEVEKDLLLNNKKIQDELGEYAGFLADTKTKKIETFYRLWGKKVRQKDIANIFETTEPTVSIVVKEIKKSE